MNVSKSSDPELLNTYVSLVCNLKKKKKFERYLRVNLLGPGRGLTKVEKHWVRLGYAVVKC